MVNKSFEVVYLEDHSLAEQIIIISGARMVISAHGAALSHLMFMHPLSRILEIRSASDAIRNCYFSLASVLSVGYHYFLAQEVDEDLIVDLGAFEACINNFVEGGEAWV